MKMGNGSYNLKRWKVNVSIIFTTLIASLVAVYSAYPLV
jgi:hypothetical protein